MDFLIYTLPRSGSAWLANFLSHGDMFCYHDPSATLGYNTVTYPREAVITGAVDTGAVLGLMYPIPKKVAVLHRDFKAIKQSFLRYTGREFPPELSYGSFLDTTRGMYRIYFEEIFNKKSSMKLRLKTLQEVWEYFSYHPFDEYRARQLLDMNVQRLFP